ncbi:MAG: S8 family peptidase [Betaproteobacteria bacterium]
MIQSLTPRTGRRKAVWGPKQSFFVWALLVLFGLAPAMVAGAPPNSLRHQKIDHELSFRAGHGNARDLTKVIAILRPGASLPPAFLRYARALDLGIVHGYALELPNGLITALANHPDVLDLHYDRPIAGANYRTSLTTGARAVQRLLGLTGAGIGVAVIDSGITSWHDDLTNRSTTLYPYGNQRVSAFVDFVNGRTMPYDDNGHGTHVAGTIAGNGYDSGGQKAGMAPDASLVSLKVLDANGGGTISNIIAALDWVAANHAQYNIRVVNMSVGAPITESYWTDPLTLAAKRVVDAGITVVAAAGNFGKNADGQPQYGGITAPGNAPWVLTVGASSTNGTPVRGDDTMASYSSRGPTYLDWAAKPDLVAPGTGTVSLADPTSTFYTTKAQYLVAGTVSTATMPYLVLSGTSMAAPVVSGTIALMLQADPNLTPNAIKAILEYTAQQYGGYDALTEGAGFLNSLGAVRLAKFFATAQPGMTIPVQAMWSKHILWGNHMLSTGVITPDANAWNLGVDWGAARTASGANIVWGNSCGDAGCDNVVWGMTGGDNIVWGNSCGDAGCDNIVWGNAGGDDNIVWGNDCGGSDCDNIVWGMIDGDNIVWGNVDPGDNIVWGNSGSTGDNIVWGMSGDDNIVWGMAGDDNIVWGMSGDDNIVWGMAGDDNIVWGMDTSDNIVWGMESGDNIVWGMAGDDNIVWSAGAIGAAGWAIRTPSGYFWWIRGSSLFRHFSDAQLIKLVVLKELHITLSSTTTTSGGL